LVDGIAATSMISLTVNGTPCSGPSASPRARAVSAARASARAASRRGSTIALIAGFRSSMRAVWASTSSTAPTSPSRTARAIHDADCLTSSVPLTGQELITSPPCAGGRAAPGAALTQPGDRPLARVDERMAELRALRRRIVQYRTACAEGHQHLGVERLRRLSMGLSDSRVEAVLAVSDLERARRFYEDGLGLAPGDEEEQAVRYSCGEGTRLFVYLSPENAGKSPATIAGWFVEDLDRTMEELESRGVRFEQYDQPGLKTDERGVFAAGDFRAAWVKDPDGNTMAITAMSG
jgi:catechol 2,3-dioxygenase-like lactoylglutathione lyase family enzyme